MFSRIVIPLDRSPLAEQAIGRAAAIARASNAGMDLVLVHQPFPVDGFNDAPWNAELWDSEKRYLETVAAGLSTTAALPVTHAVLRGEAVDGICRRIDEVHADLVVMTSHGRTGWSRAWMGSVADGVVRHAAVPVLMLRPTEGTTRRNEEAPFKRVLVPVDGSELSTEVFAAASAMARCSDARLSLLRVVQPVPILQADSNSPFSYVPELIDDPSTNRIADEARVRLAQVAQRLRAETGVDVDAQVVVERFIAPAILAFARAHDVDLIAMSTHGNRISRLLLGSVADKVLRGSEVPVLLYRSSAARS